MSSTLPISGLLAASFGGWVERLDVDWLHIGTVTLRVTLIALAAWLLVGLLQRAIMGFRRRISERLHDAEAVKRAETLGRVARYLVALAVGAIAFMLILSELGIALAPVLGAAGVVGLAIGFGAQSLVKDFFTGFFILFEDQVRTGDVVQVAGHSGVVEEITLRHVRLRDYDGNVHFVPNGMIDAVVNMSRGFAFAVIDIGIAYREDVARALQVMRDCAEAMRAEEAFAARILAPVEMVGVDKLEASAVIIRCRFRTAALAQWDVKRGFLQRVKKAFDDAGIEIALPHLTVYAGQLRDGSAPPFVLKRAPRTADNDESEGVARA
jgi:small conductance mechanosensitive channel